MSRAWLSQTRDGVSDDGGSFLLIEMVGAWGFARNTILNKNYGNVDSDSFAEARISAFPDSGDFAEFAQLKLATHLR
jgi:hypothetical protein